MSNAALSKFGQTRQIKADGGEESIEIGSLEWFEREKKLAYNSLRDRKVARENQMTRTGAPTQEVNDRLAAADENHALHYGALVLARQAGEDAGQLGMVYEKLVSARGNDPDGMPVQADAQARTELIEIGRKAETDRPARTSSGTRTPRSGAIQANKLSPQAMARMALESYRTSGVTAEEIAALREYVASDLWSPREPTAEEALNAATIKAFETALVELAPKGKASPSPAYVAVQTQLQTLATKAAAPAWGPEAKAATPETGPVDQPKGETDEDGTEAGKETLA